MPITLTFPQGRLKSDIIDLAFDDCGIDDRTAEEQTIALRKLNALMLEEPWNQLGYRQPVYGAGLPEEACGLQDDAINAVAQYLALRIASGRGITLSAEYNRTAARSLLNLQAQYAAIPEALLPGNTVRGSGRVGLGYYRRWSYTGRQ